MPKRITIYGASDDLVEIDGDLSEEFDCYDCGESLLEFNTGTKVGIGYNDDGLWRIRVIELGEASIVDQFTANLSDGDDYSDRLTLEGDFQSVNFTEDGV